jgi:hypothetical protein
MDCVAAIGGFMPEIPLSVFRLLPNFACMIM